MYLGQSARLENHSGGDMQVSLSVVASVGCVDSWCDGILRLKLLFEVLQLLKFRSLQSVAIKKVLEF